MACNKCGQPPLLPSGYGLMPTPVAANVPPVRAGARFSAPPQITTESIAAQSRRHGPISNVTPMEVPGEVTPRRSLSGLGADLPYYVPHSQIARDNETLAVRPGAWSAGFNGLAFGCPSCGLAGDAAPSTPTATTTSPLLVVGGLALIAWALWGK